MKKAIVGKTQNQPSLSKDLFTDAIGDKGYIVEVSKAFKCPCQVRGGDNVPSCANCMGSGWLFVNPTKSRMVIQSMKSSKSFSEWGIEDLGNVRITSLSKDELGYMDKIVMLNATAFFSEILFPTYDSFNNILFARCTYSPKVVENVFLFISPEHPLLRLSKDADWVLKDNYLVLADEIMQNYGSDCRLSIRYSHNPTYHLIETMRETMVSRVKNQKSGSYEDQTFPTYAIARKAHYVLDIISNSPIGNRLLDNSYVKTDQC